MKKCLIPILILISSMTYSVQKVSSESLYKEKKLSSLIEKVHKKLDDKELISLFNKNTMSCESKLIMKLNSKLLKSELVIPALIRAHQLKAIDEVESDLLINYANSFLSIEKNLGENSFRIRSGKEKIFNIYSRLFKASDSERFCLVNSFSALSRIVDEIEGDDEPTYIMQYLNHLVKKKNVITQEQFLELEMIREHQRKYISEMSIRDYYRKKARLESSGYQMNDDVLEFHTLKRASEIRSYRTDLYTRFSPFQISKMLELLDVMDKRTSAAKTQIVFSGRDGEVIDTVRLSQTEKLKAAVKLYSREKSKLLQKDIFKSANFSHRHLIALAYELGKIDDIDLAFFASLEKEVKEKGLLSTVIAKAQKYQILATLVGGPTVGFTYSLFVSLANNIINADEGKKASYNHDLFYGNCEGNL